MTHRNITYSQIQLGVQVNKWKKDVNDYNKLRKTNIQTIIQPNFSKRAISVKQHDLQKNVIKNTITKDNKKFDDQTKDKKYRFGNVNENTWKDDIQQYEKDKNFVMKVDKEKDYLIVKEAFKPINPTIPRKRRD